MEHIPPVERRAAPARLRFGGERLQLLLILLITCAHGLAYVALVPPWQHYDEPSQFENVWRLANDKPWSADGDQAFRRAVIQSMIAHDFYRDAPLPDTRPGVRVSLGLDQSNGLPLQYRTSALVVRLLRAAPLEAQLTGARLVSLIFFVVTVFAAWGCVREITREGSALRWMAPALIAMLPAFADLMTSVNDDAAATMAFTVFLWAAARLMRRGPSPGRLAFGAAAVGLCLIAKNSVFIAAPLFVLAIAFAVFARRARWAPWLLLAAGAAATLVAAVSPGDAALWMRTTQQSAGTQCAPPDCQPALGARAIRLDVPAGDFPPMLAQLLPSESLVRLAGKTVTLGAWMWACRGPCEAPGQAPVEAYTPALRNIDAKRDARAETGLTREPVFVAITVTLPSQPARQAVLLRPFEAGVAAPVTIFYDGVVLVEGARPLTQPPTFYDDAAAEGTWGGERFVNFARNGSGEDAGPFLRPFVDRLGERLVAFYNPPSSILYSLMDLPATVWYYRLTVEELHRTFWAKFGWGHVPLLHAQAYVALALLAVTGVIGAAAVMLRRRGALPWPAIAVFGLALAVFWLITLTRGVFVSLLQDIWIPRARYAYPAIVPVAVMLAAGWRGWARAVAAAVAPLRRLPAWVPFAGFVSALACFDLYALLSVVWFFE